MKREGFMKNMGYKKEQGYHPTDFSVNAEKAKATSEVFNAKPIWERQQGKNMELGERLGKLWGRGAEFLGKKMKGFGETLKTKWEQGKAGAGRIGAAFMEKMGQGVDATKRGIEYVRGRFSEGKENLAKNAAAVAELAKQWSKEKAAQAREGIRNAGDAAVSRLIEAIVAVELMRRRAGEKFREKFRAAQMRRLEWKAANDDESPDEGATLMGDAERDMAGVAREDAIIKAAQERRAAHMERLKVTQKKIEDFIKLRDEARPAAANGPMEAANVNERPPADAA